MATLLGRRCGQLVKGRVMNSVSGCAANITQKNQTHKCIQRPHHVSHHRDGSHSKQMETRCSAGKFHRPLTTNEAVLLKDIETNNDVDSLFALLKTKRSWLTTAHIGAAMNRLLDQQKFIVDEPTSVDKMRNYIRLHPEFHGLCILAENKVRDMDNITLVNTLYALLKFVSDQSHSLVAEIITEVDRRLSTFTIKELAIFAACSQDALDPKSVLLGKVTEIFHKFIEEEAMDVRDAATLFRATVGLTSYRFRKQIYIRLLKLFDKHKNEVSTNDLRKILQSISIANDRPELLLQECTSLLHPRIESLSIWELSVIYHSLEGPQEGSHQHRNHIVKRMEDLLPACKNSSDLVRIITVLAPHASPQLKFRLEELADAAIPMIPAVKLGNLCVALRVMGFRVPSHLISSIADKFEMNSGNVQFLTLLRVVEFFQSTRLPHDAPIFKFLEMKVLSVCQTAISPLRILGITYLLSLLPLKNLDPDIINRLDRMLHQYNVASINQLFLALTRISKKLDNSTKESIGINHLLQKLNVQAVEKINDVTSLVYLNNMIHHMLDECTNSLMVSTVMSHYSKCLHRLTPQLAVECARNVVKTRFLQIPLLDAVADVTSKSISRVTPRQVLSLLSPYCVLNYRPQNTPDFFDICLRRFMPYMDHVPSIFLLDMAFLLSLVKIFPEELLQKLFNLQFLIKLEEEVDATTKSNMYRQRLMQLNRAVVIECSHLWVPWFHEDYCLEMRKTRTMYFPKELKSLQRCLSEILGGPQFFRSFVFSPYYYEIDFECVLDADGNPLPCADYGSMLNRSGQVTRTVMSDLMQWGTQTKQLPKGGQRIAIDFLSKSQFCLNSRHASGMVATKKRHLEVMGYKYIQIPHYVWDSLILSEHDDELSYLQELILDKNSTSNQVAQRHSPLVRGHQHGSDSRGSVEQEAMIIKLLHLLDRVS